MKLVPGGVIPEVHLVRYGDEMTVIPDYRGLVKLLRGRGGLLKAEARTVKQGEHFEVHYGTDPRIEHDPKFDGSAGEPFAYYAVAWFQDGTQQFDVMMKEEVDNVRDHSQGKNSLMWTDYYDEGAKKTVLKRLCKLLPVSGTAAVALHIDDDLDAKEVEATVILDEGDGQSVIEDIKDRLAKKTKKAKPAPKEESPAPLSQAHKGDSSPHIKTIMGILSIVPEAEQTAFLRDALGDNDAEPVESYFRTFGDTALEQMADVLREALEAPAAREPGEEG